ncbi:hypothetical protein D3C77_120960 [compost metagenome]
MHGSNHTQLLEAWKVLGVDHLQVADTVHLVRVVELACKLNAIERLAHCTIANRVHVDDPVTFFGCHHQLAEVRRFNQQLAIFFAVLVGFKHRSGLPGVLQHTINEHLDTRETQVGHAFKLLHYLGQYFKVSRLALGVGDHQGSDMGVELALLGQRAVQRQHAVALFGGFEIKQRIVAAGVGGRVHPGRDTVLIVDLHRFTGGLEHEFLTGGRHLATHLVPARLGKIPIGGKVSLVTDVAAVLFR